MNFAAVYHKASGHYCYPLNVDEMIVNIKTGYDVDRLWICYGDPYANGIAGSAEKWQGVQEEIVFKKNLAHQIWWTTTIRPEFKRVKYYFILQSGSETWYYLEDGFVTKRQMELDDKMLQYFIFPWMNPADICRTPKWVNDTVWYQIFPDRFCNGDFSIDPAEVHPWRKGEVTNYEFFGGDLEGIIRKLDYLRDLGINGIYLTPIFQSPSVHKYDTTDYLNIDPGFGDKEVFRRLVKEAHARGIRVMIDGVFNHCGKYFMPWRDVLQKGPKSPYYHWFMINHWPFDQQDKSTRDGKYFSFAFYGNMPKMNTNNPEVIDYFADVCEYWVREFDVDGLRFDVANEVSHKFCRAIRSRLKAVKEDVYLLGEIWHDSGEWLHGDEYDAVMNYPLTSSINDFWVDRSLMKKDFEYMINRSYTMYRQQNNNALFNLLDSHDTDRLMTRNHGNEDAFYQQLAVLFTMPGSPCIFYGTEIGQEGGHDPDCRRCMPWEEIESGALDERIHTMKSLIAMRKNNRSCRSLYFHFSSENSQTRVVDYLKLTGDGEQIRVVLNCSEEDFRLDEDNILFARKYQNRTLAPGGVLICKTCDVQ